MKRSFVICGFTYHKPNSVSASSADAVICLVSELLRRSHPPMRRNIAALPAKSGTRPCARVRILPFHSRCCHRDSPHAAKSFAGRIFLFRKIRLCSHLYPDEHRDDGCYPLPCYPINIGWEFGLSSSPRKT